MGLISFLQNRAGNVAMIFALSAVPLLGMVAGAADFQMATSERRQMQDALDAATLEVISREANGTRADREAMLVRSYRANGGRGTPRLTRDMSQTNGLWSMETAAQQDMPTTILGLVGVSDMNLGVSAAAERRPTLQSMRFRFRYITGAYDKRITLYGTRDGGAPVALMNIIYSWPNRYDPRSFTTIQRLVNGSMVDTARIVCPSYTRGTGSTTTVLAGDGTAEADTSDYDHLYLQMSVSASNPVSLSYLWANLPRTIRSDDPNLSYRLFMNGVQVPVNTTVNLLTSTPCGVWSTQDWEDGGNGGILGLLLSNTDVHYDVQGTCGFSDTRGGVRLSR